MDKWDGNSRIFSGYYRGSAKRPSEKIKDVPGHSFEEVSSQKSFGAKLQPGVIDISFDDKEMSERFLDIADARDWRCLALENPTNGHIHTYWRDPAGVITKSGKDIKLACGLIADIHMGATYIPLKVDGVERFPPVYDINEDEEYQAVPTELLPVNTEVTLWKSSGRNDDMYRYILILQSQLIMGKDDIRDMYRNVINPFIFASPLEDTELDIILRDESFDKTDLSAFYVGTSFRHDRFGEYIRQKYHVIYLDHELWIYKDGAYYADPRWIEKCMIEEIPKLKDSQRKEVLRYLNSSSEELEPADERYISFTNGVLDLETGEMQPPSPDFIITNLIPWEYNPDAYDPLCDKVLNQFSCDDPQIRALLEECVGACFYRSNKLASGAAFILTGGKANGKSTFLETVREVLGKVNTSALDMSQIGGDRFSAARLQGKLANIGDDISDEYLQGKGLSILKKVITGNEFHVEHKGAEGFDLEPYCKLLFSANDIPRMKDRTGAMLRRMVIIPFNGYFAKRLPDGSKNPNCDPNIGKKLTSKESMEYLVRLGVEGLQRVLRDGDFTQSDKSEKQKIEYEEENDPLVGFIKEQGEDQIINQPTADVFTRYQVCYQGEGGRLLTRINFTKQICRYMDLVVKQKKINGKVIRIFMKEEQ